jgi:hypothetical protein
VLEFLGNPDTSGLLAPEVFAAGDGFELRDQLEAVDEEGLSRLKSPHSVHRRRAVRRLILSARSSAAPSTTGEGRTPQFPLRPILRRRGGAAPTDALKLRKIIHHGLAELVKKPQQIRGPGIFNPEFARAEPDRGGQILQDAVPAGRRK